MNFIEEAKEAIKLSSPESTIYVGCDSNRYKKKGVWYASYAKVIIVHRDSKHGCKVFSDIEILRDYGNLRQRLFQEVMFATDLAMEIADEVGERGFEIHLDINPSKEHKSSVVVKEALGYVRGMTGREAVIKPNSFAAMHCADHFCRI